MRLLRDHPRLRHDLAHLVDGRPGPGRAPSPPSSCLPGATEAEDVIPAAEEVAQYRPRQPPRPPDGRCSHAGCAMSAEKCHPTARAKSLTRALGPAPGCGPRCSAHGRCGRRTARASPGEAAEPCLAAAGGNRPSPCAGTHGPGRDRCAPPRRDPNHLGPAAGARTGSAKRTEHAERRPASKRIIAGYGFWIFLLSDIIMFAPSSPPTPCCPAKRRADHPAGATCSTCATLAVETGCLPALQLHLRAGQRRAAGAQRPLVLRRDGGDLRAWRGVHRAGADGSSGPWSSPGCNGPGRSAFLSAFFALVGLHGTARDSAGLLWLLTMMAQVWAKGYRSDILRRVMCFSLFWHALDIVWVALFTVVYLMGVQVMSGAELGYRPPPTPTQPTGRRAPRLEDGTFGGGHTQLPRRLRRWRCC